MTEALWLQTHENKILLRNFEDVVGGLPATEPVHVAAEHPVGGLLDGADQPVALGPVAAEHDALEGAAAWVINSVVLRLG